MTRTIAIAMQKGGCGKTTVAAQLAWGLSSRGFTTLVVDFDPQSANVTAALGAMTSGELPYSTADFLLEPAKPFAPVHIAERLDLVPANLRFARAEYLVGQHSNSWGPVTVAKAFKRLAESEHKYNFVLCDCPPNFSAMLANVLAACDEIIAPVSMDQLSVQAVDDLQAVLAELGENPFRPRSPVVTYVATFFKHNNRESAAAFALAQKLCVRAGGRLSDARIPDATAIARAAGNAAPIWNKAYNDSPAAQEAFYRLVDEVLGVSEPMAPASGASV
jgi:chromosome partitioning protein